MGCGRRCGCWAISELELERSRHQATLADNTRHQRHNKELRDELATLHSTIADLERRYSDLSARHRTTLHSLDDVNDTSSRLKDHSEELVNENRRLRAQVEKLTDETHMLNEELDVSRSDIEEERRRRLATEVTMSRDLDETQKNCNVKLRRAVSLHDMDKHNLKHDIEKLKGALETEKFRHTLTYRDLYDGLPQYERQPYDRQSYDRPPHDMPPYDMPPYERLPYEGMPPFDSLPYSDPHQCHPYTHDFH